MMNKEQKKNYIEEMINKFENSKAVMVTHYQGLTMNQLDELRVKMREHGIIFKITKNRITKLALEKEGIKGLYFRKNLRRSYPQKNTTAHVVGLTDIDRNGIQGTELVFNNELFSKSISD